MASEFAHPVDDRYFDDYVEGSVHVFGDRPVEEQEVLAFARRYDPQWFHTEPQAAKNGPFGGLIASGWHTVGMMMAMVCEHYLSTVASLASPGVDRVRWRAPVRPGDRLRVQATVAGARLSASKPDRGVVTTDLEVFNQDDALVLTLTATNFLATRPG